MYRIPFHINLKCYVNEYSTFLPKRYTHTYTSERLNEANVDALSVTSMSTKMFNNEKREIQCTKNGYTDSA